MFYFRNLQIKPDDQNLKCKILDSNCFLVNTVTNLNACTLLSERKVNLCKFIL